MSEKESAGIVSVLALLDGTDDAGGTVQQISQISKLLTGCEKYAPSLSDFAARARELDAQATALSKDLADALLRMEYSPQQLSDTEARLDLIHRLVTKYATPADELEELLTSIESEIHVLENADDNIDELKALYSEKRHQVAALSEKLHNLRQQAAQQMTACIERELQELDMPAARFAVEISSTLGATQTKFTKKGTDTVRFLLSANRGEELRPLSKVASGGELSRIMLALKNVLSAGEESVTAVFDEVDTGVSGRAASRVGEKLYAIAQQRQVLCVTHLPQIACLADHQYRIIKFSENGRTFTQVNLLDTEGRIEELARLTAGVHITEATLIGARELLHQAQTHKKS